MRSDQRPLRLKLSGLLQLVVRATRLREVRANCGFTRIFPPMSGDKERIAKISFNPLDWLPAVENRGEGLFLQLNLDKVKEWEQKQVVKERVSSLQQACVLAQSTARSNRRASQAIDCQATACP